MPSSAAHLAAVFAGANVTLVQFFQLVLMAWGAAELLLMARTKARGGSARQGRRGSVWIVWCVIAVSMGGAIAAQFADPPRLPGSARTLLVTGIVVMLAGLVLRVWAILTLGRMFSVDVAIQSDHRVVQHGPYARLRHPSYTGLLLVFLGYGLGLGNVASLAIALVPTALVIVYRVRVEERALREEFGAEYEAYAARTSRLVPGLY